jgi:vancomycin resistance protein YoaR
MSTYQQVPGAYGYALDLERAKEMLEAAQYGETISLPMTYVRPEILADEVYFRDELGYCETPHSNNANRATNLKLACASLDGLILQPGEEFSYNNTLGQRTAERGYKPAPAYSGTRLVDSIGGGICQVSSTLYCATLYADMETVFRINHGYKSSYIGLGLDATVSWGKPDFQFRNSSNFPIMLKAETTDTHVKIKILGTEVRDYYVKMTSGYTEDDDSIYCWSYKSKYDRETNELISKEKEAYSRYSK